MAQTVEQFGKALAASGLMAGEDLKAFWGALKPEERPRDGDGLAALLVERSKLTKFQAQELLAGRGAALVMGDYLLLAEIGSGGMGKVYKAQHRRMKRVVALKVMSSAAMQDDAAVKRFQREVEAAARLEHPNIVTAYDSGEAGKVKYLVMQFVDGGDLSDHVKKNGPLPIEAAVGYVMQAARGLAFAHAAGVVHRDIKPANLLLDKKGVVKILDMGLARIEDGDGLTATEQVMGTVDYMSPEQAAETKNADGRSDIYSLGCTLWYLLSAKKLYDGDTMISRLMKHRDAELPSLVKTRDDATWPLEQVLHKMIAKRPQDRYQSMDEIVAALEPFAGGGAATSGGMGSSIGGGKGQSAELASFMQAMAGAKSAEVTKPPGSSASVAVKPPTSTSIDATSAFSASEVGTDPKSQHHTRGLPPIGAAPAGAAKTQTKAMRKKAPPVKLIAAGVLGLALIAAGIIVTIRNKKGEVVAELNVPNGASATVTTTPAVAPLPAATKAPSPVAAAANSQVAGESPPPGDYALELKGYENLAGGAAWVDVPSLLLSEVGPLTLEARVWKIAHNEGFVLGAEALRLRLRGNQWTMWFHDDYRLQLPLVTAEGRWQHLALVRTASEIRMYVDGKRTGAMPLPVVDGPQPARKSTPLKIGGNNANLRVDEVRISKSARYDQDFTPPLKHALDADTLALYHCDDGAGDVLRDASPNKHDGKITKPKWVLPDGAPIPSPPAFGGSIFPGVSRRSTASGAPPPPSTGDILTSPDYVWTEPENLGPTVNRDQEEKEPAVSADGLCLIFNSGRTGRGDLFECRRKSVDEPWKPAVALDAVNLRANYDHQPWLSADGLTLLFAGSGAHGNVNSYGESDLWQSRRTSRDAPWDTPENLGPQVNATSHEKHPRLSADGLTLFFNSHRSEQGEGLEDIWRSRRTSLEAPWEKPVLLEPPVNTRLPETSSQPLSDGRSFLFLQGYSGERRLTLAEATADGGYTVRQLDFPDQKLESFWLLADGRTMYFESDRPGGLGGRDLWMTRRVPKNEASPAPAAQAQVQADAEFNGHRYRFVSSPGMTYADARLLAEKSEGRLASVTDQAEFDFVQKLIPAGVPDDSRVWIGGERAGHDANWKWTGGEPWGFTAWGKDEPNVVKQTTARLMLRTTPAGVTWVDESYDKTDGVIGYIVEWNTKVAAATATSDDALDRKVAQWLLDAGLPCIVKQGEKKFDLKPGSALPDGPLTFYGINSTPKSMERAALLAGLADFQRMNQFTFTFLPQKDCDVWAEAFAAMPNIVAVNAGGCRELTDAGAAHLAKLPKLEYVNLSDCSLVTHVGLAAFEKCATLQTISVSEQCLADGKYALADVQRLQDALPKTRVVFGGVKPIPGLKPAAAK